MQEANCVSALPEIVLYAVFITKYHSQSVVCRSNRDGGWDGGDVRLRKFVWPFLADDWRLEEATDRNGVARREISKNYFRTLRRRLLKIYINLKSYFFMTFIPYKMR